MNYASLATVTSAALFGAWVAKEAIIGGLAALPSTLLTAGPEAALGSVAAGAIAAVFYGAGHFAWLSRGITNERS